MNAMAAPGFDLAPDLTRDGLNILDTQAAGVVDPVIVIDQLMFCIVLSSLEKYANCYSPLIGFGLSEQAIKFHHQLHGTSWSLSQLSQNASPMVSGVLGSPLSAPTGLSSHHH